MIRVLAGILIGLVASISSVSATPIQITGFETGAATDDTNATGGTFSITTTAPISGTYSFQSNPLTTAVGWIQLYCVGADGLKAQCNAATSFIRFNFKAVTLPASGSEEIIYVADAATSRKMSLRITSTGNLAAYNSGNALVATSATVLSAGTTYRIGFKVGTSAGTAAYQVDINGVTDANLSGTAASLSSNMASFYVGKSINTSSQTVDLYFDDILVDDAAMPGAGQVLGMVPTSNGSTMQWFGADATCSTTPANCYTRVSEIPTDGDTSSIRKNTAAAEVALMRLATAAASGISGSIAGVKAYMSCKEVTSITSSTSIRIRSNSANSDSTTLDGTTAYQTQSRILAVDPGTALAFTLADLNQIEIGATDGALSNQVRCSTMRLFVDFNSAGGGGGAGGRLLAATGAGL